MRVLITTDTVGGVWDYSLGLVEGLLRKHCFVTLVSLGEAPDDEQTCAIQKLVSRFADSLRFISTNFPLEWMQGDLRLDQSCAYLLALIRSFHPDIVHFNQMCYGILDVDAPKIVVAHSDVTSWSYHCGRQDRLNDGWHQRYRRQVSSGLEGADAVVAPSKFQLNQLEGHYGVLGKRGFVIYNGCQTRDVQGPKTIQAVSAGRFWDIGKNLRLLARVEWDLPVYVAGRMERDGHPTDSLEPTCSLRQLGQLDKESFHQLLDTSLIYIGPSLYEPFGLAPLEAAQSGCVLVLSDIPSFREIWEDAAIFFAPDDPQTLARIVDDLVTDRSRCKSMASLARERARSRYSLNKFVDSYFDLYQQVISRRIDHAA